MFVCDVQCHKFATKRNNFLIILGFSTNPKTWLPVNKNYVTLNLAAQKTQDNSYYALYKAVSALRVLPAIKQGTLNTNLLNDDVLFFARYSKM